MREGILHFLEATIKFVELPDPIIEIGPSPQYEERFTFLARGRTCLTVDINPETGARLVADCMSLPFGDNTVGTVVILETLEHIRNPFEATGEIARVLKPDGICIASTPYDLPIHMFPKDYFRPSPDGLDTLFETFPRRLLGYQGRPEFPHTVLIIAFRDSSADIVSLCSRLVQELRSRKEKNQYGWMKLLPHFSKNPYVRSLTLANQFQLEPRIGP